MNFDIDSRALEEDRASRPELEEAGFLRHTYFQMPITISISGTEIFRKRTGIFYMATRGLDVVEGLRDGSNAEITPPNAGRLRFEVNGDAVLVTETTTGRRKSTNLALLKEAWRRFAQEVRAFLLLEFPSLKDNPEVREWFRGEER